MASGVISHKWLMRIAFVITCLVILFLQLLPLETTPRRWAGPDLLIVLTVAWAGRQPKYTPPIVVALVFLLADLLLMRPPGMLAAVMVIAVEVQRHRAPSQRAATFLAEWAYAAALMVAIALAYRVGLTLFFVERASLGLTLMQVIMNVMIYPFIVLLSAGIFGVRRSAVRDTGMGATA
ncbi:rod shape-determining protein MreD [Shimia abyssi]|uniref:Rod shape-determining protein MreD n=1 Tax=Shimia abyssi TaxID=1662395 RepID=A0A2P8FKC7_9RHOB|nr:rod shape-determining protein MreD [Shimia abyssi]PSL22170.1 rod shape-determining protein MreD [Shimia abyssi]